MEENSKKMKSGLEKAPHRSLLYALGLTREEMERPLVGVVNAASEVVPGHLHLGKLAEAVKAGVRMACLLYTSGRRSSAPRCGGR